MIDQSGRSITYLRISVIDRCNLRCTYCVPEGLHHTTRLTTLLTNDEIVELASLFAELGITKIRLTGGEPLLRPGVVEMVERIASIPDIREVALSTNGILLARHARALKQAGLDRVNVSLDTLCADTFAQLTGSTRLSEVVEGILSARAAGLSPVKMNVVLMRGINDHEVLDLVAFAVEHALELRFIEWMPTDSSINASRSQRFLSNEVAREHIERRYTLLADDIDSHAPARRFMILGTDAHVGFISPLSNAFCSSCNRIRLKANGRIKTCLHGHEELDLRAWLRDGMPRDIIKRHIASTVFLRPEEHFLNNSTIPHNDFVMTQVGG